MCLRVGLQSALLVHLFRAFFKDAKRKSFRSNVAGSFGVKASKTKCDILLFKILHDFC